jgi:UPF0271 protein
VKFDLNSDLGEGEPPATTRSLMRIITSANVACGGHAGNVHTMEQCVRLAKEFRVRLGAHPGPWSRADLGRGAVDVAPDELDLVLLEQVAALERIAGAHGLRLHHVKLHGALYHATERSDTLAWHYVLAVARWWPTAKIYALAGGRVARIAQRAGVPVWAEIYADRGYSDDGSLVRRGKPGALITNSRTAAARIRRFLATGNLESLTGKLLPLRARTVCVHSDTPNAAAIARSVRKTLGV